MAPLEGKERIMQLNISGTNVEMKQDERTYIERKLAKLERYFDHMHGEAHYTTERNFHVLEVKLHAGPFMLHAEERSDDFKSATDLVFEKLERQVRRYHDRLTDHLGRNSRTDAAALAPSPEPEPPVEEKADPRILRVKRFEVKPMTPEEAALQMDLLEHDFFVFVNAQTQQVSVIYRRRDAGYGLIEPEF
jgi:putative sigma-54 modulation protein